MAFREVIEAVLKVKDANRFKAGMDKAARSVRKLGRDDEIAAAQTKLLEQVLERLDRQAVETTAALTLVAHSVDELGDEMTQTAAKAALMNTVMKKSGSNAVFLGKSWAFWKDRLSLTRSEVVTTALTIGTYLSPALVALGSSFANAALGGGAVAAGGLSSFVFGLGLLASVVKPAINNLKKINKAQDQYNLAVAQYGGSSLQASRASAHLYGIIDTQGGKSLSDAAVNIRNFRNEWSKATAPARGSILDILSGGAKAGRNLTPTLSLATNQIALSMKNALQGVFKTFTGPEMKANFRVMADVFDKSIGPGLRGATNVVVVFGRIIRASAPWVIKWAQAWERTTHSWRSGTRDQSKVENFINNAVIHFKAWWELAKALGRTLKIIFSVSKDEGLGFVGIMTEGVNTFNEWLTRMKDTGQVAKFWAFWKNSIATAFDIITHPNTWMATFIVALDQWLPVVMNHIATAFVMNAPVAASLFVHTFREAGAWAQLLTVAYFLKKFGFFKWLGAAVASIFIGPFLSAFGGAFATGIGVEAGAGGTIGRAAASAGTRAGALFGGAFYLAAILSVALIGEAARREIDKAIRDKLPGGRQLSDAAAFLTKNLPGPQREGAAAVKGLFDQLFPPKKKKTPGGALGGIIAPGGVSIVGETGPELAAAGARGTSITPLSRNSRHTLPTQLDIPNLENALHITVYSKVNIDKREIGRAVTEQAAYDATRRGGLSNRLTSNG